jgi:hypothetical protein
LTDTSNSLWPLIASGFAAPANGTYAAGESADGGVWKGKAAIVIRCDISGKVERLVNMQVQRTENDNANAFTYTAAAGNNPEWLTPTASVLNPTP